jgi:DNA repair exonuclease SbcCD ATPase subunit
VKEQDFAASFKEREKNLGRQIDEQISEKKKL